MNEVAAFVLAGGRVADLGVLTQNRAKASVPFAGSYRIIDFAMSNLALSGVDRVGVLSQYRPSSLMDHISDGSPWGLVGRGREVRVLPPFQAESRVDWYRGSADAVYQNLRFLRNERLVMVVSGDHVYHMDYGALLGTHLSSGADLTMAVKRLPLEQCSRFGVAELDESGRVTGYEEKPDRPIGDHCSLTVYLFRREALQGMLAEQSPRLRDTPGDFHLYQHVVPEMVRQGRVQAHVFDGYWAYTRTVDEFFEASLDVLDSESGLDLANWEIYTNLEQSGLGDVPPAYLGAGSRVSGSLVCPGCRVMGDVRGSILSPGVVVHAGAQVRDSVLMHGVEVEPGACVTRVMADKHVRIGRDCCVGTIGRAVSHPQALRTQASGVTVLGRDAELGEGCVIGGNCQVGPTTRLSAGTVVADGKQIEAKGEGPWYQRW